MGEQSAEVIVIGGGAAGLAAAGVLASAGLQTLVLEARPRLGGRIDTLFDPLWPVPIERGAEFVHGRPKETWEIIREAALAAYEIDGQDWRKAADRLLPADQVWEQAESVLGRLQEVGPEDESFAEFLDRRCSDLPLEARTLAMQYVEGFNAADQHQISALALRESERAARQVEGDRLFRIQGGYGRMIEWLRAGVPGREAEIHLGMIVTAIHWQPGNVGIECRPVTGGELILCQAPRVVITLPLGVLQAPPEALGAVRFSPPLPQEKSQALTRLRMGPVVKVLLRFDEAFWEGSPLDSMSFLHAPESPLPTWWTMLPLRVPVLTGWAGGPAAERLAELPERAILDQALASLSTALSIPRSQLDRRLQAWHVGNWQADPFARGAYSYVLAGGMGAVADLARPVAKTLYFAGEATEGGFSGTVNSALASGYRAAGEVLSDLRKD